jgi:alpha-methylacyl-CoA racemase
MPGVSECKDGRCLAVGALEPAFQRNLCEAIGIATLDRALLAERLRERTRDEWFAILRGTDTCVAPVYALDEVFTDPHHLARGSRIEVDHPRLGKVPQVAVAPRLSATPGAVRRTTPRAGAQTLEVLREAGYDDERIDELARTGAVGAAG